MQGRGYPLGMVSALFGRRPSAIESAGDARRQSSNRIKSPLGFLNNRATHFHGLKRAVVRGVGAPFVEGKVAVLLLPEYIARETALRLFAAEVPWGSQPCEFLTDRLAPCKDTVA